MLKHMPPGPSSSGQPRPPTRGLLHTRPPQPLNVSTLSATVTGSGGPGPPKIIANGGPRLSSVLNTTPLTCITPTSNSNNNNNNNNNTNSGNNNNNGTQQTTLAGIVNSNHNHNNNNNNNNHINLNSTIASLNTKHRIGAREALTSLGLLCLVSLLLALLSLIFLLKISPGGRELPPPPPPPPPGPTSPEDYIIVYDVTLALCALSLSLNLCCLLVCAIQFLFAVKLVRAPATTGRGNKYLQKSSVSRVCAVGGFFISIPIFLTGIILYTFTQFHSTPAIITSILIGIGIVFCGAAMVHNVFVWQKEKTICVRNSNPLNLTLSPQISTISSPQSPLLLPNQSSAAAAAAAAAAASAQYMNHSTNHLHLNVAASVANHTPLTHTSQLSHLTPISPLSPNHSHISFNHSYVPGYAVRAATATPPTPKVTTATAAMLGGRDASGSVSPGMPTTTTLDMSNVTNTSPHELSTLV